MEDFIIELIERRDPGIVNSIPNYIQGHMAQYGRNASFERDRVAQAVADRAPNNREIISIIETSDGEFAPQVASCRLDPCPERVTPMTVVPVRYTLYFWNPPVLTPEQEVSAGRHIVMTGGPEAWKKKAPHMPEMERARVEAYATTKRTVPQLILAVAVLLGFLAIIVAAGPRLWIPLGVVCVTVLPLSLYTLATARKRYHSWIDKVIAAYLDDAEKAARAAAEVEWSAGTQAVDGPRPESRVRGSILIRPGQRSIITLTERADASTFIHEMAHDWLEQLRRYAAHPLAPPQLRADWQTVKLWLGGEADIHNVRTPGAKIVAERQHEKFARGWEQYMREGNAASPQLAETFAKYKQWLTEIYPTEESLDVKLTPEIRGVFDRMLSI